MARIRPDALASRVATLCAQYLRPPVSIATDDTNGSPIIDFDPVLTTAEQASYADLLAMAQSDLGSTITLAEYQAIKPFLATGRAFLGLSQSDFIALGQNARDRMLHENVSALWRVIFRLMRE